MKIIFRSYRSILMLFPLALFFLVQGCQEQDASATTDVAKVWPVKVYEISEANNLLVRHFAGRVRAVQTVDLSFQVGGKLSHLDIVEGQIIPEGKLIAQLDDRDYLRRVKEAKVNLELLEKTVTRQRALASRNAISDQLLDETESNYSLAKVALENAEQDYAYTRLSAPFDALATRQLVENFTNVQPGQGIVRLQDVSETRIEVSAPEQLLATINPEQVVSITAKFDFIPDKEFALEYREHQSEANSVTQTYVVELGMARPEEVLILPGMTARVTLKLKQSGNQISIPLAAVQTDADGSSYVWAIGESGEVSKTSVVLGTTNGDFVFVTDGLAQSMRIVAAGGQHLYAGALVRDYNR